jgi:hypothetical protein
LLDRASAKLKFGSGREHLEHFATPASKRRALGVGTMAQLTVPLGMGH